MNEFNVARLNKWVISM